MIGTWEPSGGEQPVDMTETLAALYEPEQLILLARALGGGQYPGIGQLQNDTIDTSAAVANGTPGNFPFLLPGNMVKFVRAVLSFKLLGSATGVTVLIDTVDYTSQLNPPGPYSTDQFELDITTLGWAKTKGIHTCQLTSTASGTIVAWIRTVCIVNPLSP